MASQESPFGTLKLTDDEEQLCYDRASQLLDRTLRSYDERDGQSDRLHHAKVDNARWKRLKTQENASLYVERSGSAHGDDGFLGGDWENPVAILTTGTIRGDLDDVMLGLKALNVNSIRSRTELLTNRPVDSAVLVELLGPTAVDPFRFLGVTWLMYEQSWPLKSMVRPRDLLTLTSTGTMTRANGDRVGYEVVQPTTLPQCPQLGSVMRGKVMYAAIFKQLEPGVVDVFIPTYVETQGVVLDKVVVGVTWKATLGFWNALELGELKKLQWCIANCRSKCQKEQQEASSSSISACKRCFERPSVARRFSGASHAGRYSCILCGSPVCSKCRAERILKDTDAKSGRLKDNRVAVPAMLGVCAERSTPRYRHAGPQEARRAKATALRLTDV